MEERRLRINKGVKCHEVLNSVQKDIRVMEVHMGTMSVTPDCCAAMLLLGGQMGTRQQSRIATYDRTDSRIPFSIILHRYVATSSV